MLHDHPQESPLKSSLFSRPPQHPLEINSVYRPKFSKIVCDKFFNKPFYQRENKSPQNTEEKQVRAKVDQVMKQFNGKENATSEDDAVDSEIAGKELPPSEDSDGHVEPLHNNEARSDVGSRDMDDKDHSSTNVSTKVLNNAIPSGTKRKDTIGQHFVHKRGPTNGTEAAAQSQVPLQQQLFGAAFPQPQSIFVPSALPSFATPSLTSPLAPFPTSHPFIANQRFKFTPHVQDKSIDGSAQVQQSVPATMAGCYGVSQNNSGKEYYVMVHVDAGEVFSIRIGDHVQHIPGPATVRLVSNTGPPLPMPIHVPAGHLVQQIVDEEGILTHMILSPFPGPPSPYLKDGAPIMASPGSSTDVSNGPHLPTNKQLPRIFPNPSERPGAPLFCGGGGSIGGAYQPGPRRSGFGAQLPPLQPHHLQASVTHIGIPLITQPYQQLQSNTTGGGFNVVISPKTSPGLAVAGPTAASPVVPWQPSLPQLSEVNAAAAPPVILGMAGAEQSKCPVIPAKGTAFTEETDTGTKVCNNDTIGTETAVNGSNSYDKETASVSPDDAADEHDRNDCTPKEAAKSSPVIGCEPEPLRNGIPSPDSKKPRKKKDSKSLTAKKTGRSPDSNRSIDEGAAKATTAADGAEKSNVTSPTKSSSGDPKVSPTAAANRSSTSSRKNPTGAKRKTAPQSKINQNCTGALSAEADALVSKETTHLQTSTNLKMSNDQSAETSVCSTDASTKTTTTTTTTPSTAGANAPSGGGVDKKGAESGLLMHFPGLLPGGVFPLCPSHPHHHHPLVPQFYGAPSLPFHPDQIPSMTLRPGLFAGPPQFHPSPSAPPGPSSQPGPPPPPPPPPPTFMAPFNPYFIPHPTMLPPHSIYHYPCEFLSGPPQFKPTSSFTEEECAAILKVLSKISQPKISSVDCRSVTINLSIPENLSIVPTEAATTQVAPATTAVMPSTTDAATAPTAANMDALVPNTNPSDSATQTDPVLQSRIWSISPSDLRFGLYLAENDGVFNCVYLGETPCILLQDLRPAVRYFIKACCIYEGLMGSFSETADFVTLSTKPSVLRPPVVMSKTKNSLSIRWTSAADNGSRITEYCLQFATLPKAGNLPVFYNCYKGPQRFHKLNHLNPSTSYLLRVCATNSHGQSPWSDAVSATTSGLPPPTPEPPHLLEATSQSLRLSWRPRTPPPPQSNQDSSPAGEEQNPEETKVRSPRRGVRHVLEMLDAETKQQQQQQQQSKQQQSQQRFKQVYEGEALECMVEGLRRSSLYRFRLAAGNSDGLSAWSDPVAFRTAPDNPSAPRSLRLRGRVRPYQVNLCWLLPDDDGGLPVQSYRLEVQLARLPTSVLLRQLTTTHDANDAPLSTDAPAASTKEQTELGQAAQVPICWPWVIAPVDDTTFTSRPPSSLVLQTPSAALTGLCITKQSVLRRVPSNPKLPRRVTSSAKAVRDRCDGVIAGEDSIGGGDEDAFSFSDSSPSGSDSDAEQQHGQQELAWYSIYEGRAKEVTVCNLTPGLTLQFRVRATSERPEGPPAKTTDTPQLPRQISWGPASPCPLKLTTPAVPPMNPPAKIRLYGRPRPNGLRIIWDPPASNGGAPIVSYELWQSVSDPLSGSPLNSPTRSNPRTNPGSGSMCNLASAPATTTAVVKAAVSAPTTAASSPVHKVHSGGRGPLPTTPHAPKTPASLGQLVYSGPEADCWVGGLRAGQAYAFRARAKNATGWSGWSAWQTLSTAASPPEEPRTPPRVLPLSPTSVSVAWDPVVRVNGAEVTEYRVEWQSAAPGCEIATTNTADDELGDVLESNLVGEYGNASCGPRNPSLSPTSCSKSSVCQCSSFQLVYTGLERRFELHNIQPASHLSFRVCAVNSAGAGRWSALGRCVMPPSYPDQPFELGLDRSLHNESTFPSDPVAHSIAMVDGVSLSSAHLIWTAPLDNGCPITHYNLEVAKYNDAGQPSVDGKLKDAPQLLRLRLECGDHHCRSVGGYPHELTLSDDVSFAQSPASISPGGCQGSAEKVAFRFCPPDAAETGSVLSVPGVRTDWSNSRSTKSVRFTLTGLQPDTKYRVRIQAVNAVGEGPFSGFFHFSTLPPLPPAPILTCFGSTAGGIKLHWSLPPPVSDSTTRAAAAPDLTSDQASAKWPPLRYTLEISRKPESKGWSVIYEGNQCAFKVRRLTEATAYYFRVVATNISGTGLFSPTLCVKTTYAPPPPVKAPSISEVGPTSCQVEWQPLNAMGQDPLIYVLQIMRVQHGNSDLDDKAVTVYRGAQTSYLLGGLSSGADYIARVCAIRLCQVPVENSELVVSPSSHSPSSSPSSSSSLKPNNCIASGEDVRRGSNNMERPEDCNNTNRPVDHSQPSLMQYRLLELAGPFSVGTAFTTVHEVRPTRATFDLRAFFTSTAETSPVLQIQLRNTAGTTATATTTAAPATLLHPVGTSCYRGKNSRLTSGLVLLASTFKQTVARLKHHTSNLAKDGGNSLRQLNGCVGLGSRRPRNSKVWTGITDKQAAVIFLVGFLVICLAVAWGFHQLWCSEESTLPNARVLWPPGGSVEDGIPSARAAFWSTNRYHSGAEAQPALQPQQQQNQP